MKSYSSIPNSFGQKFVEFNAYVFDKIDGSNLRFEFSSKQGWYKFGTRTRLMDRSDPDFGLSIDLFIDTLAHDLDKVIRANNIKNLTVFAEFAGENSFAGLHNSQDEKHLYLFDAAVDKKGLVTPQEFLHLFGNCQIVKFLGVRRWSKSFVVAVRNSDIEGITFEGVVGKNKGKGNTLLMSKAKTQAWIDKVKSLYHYEEAERLIKS